MAKEECKMAGSTLNNLEPHERIIVALDNIVAIDPRSNQIDRDITASRIDSLVAQLKEKVGYFKIGLELFTAIGPTAIEIVKRHSGEFFLDLKFHDIPNTVGQATWVAASYGATFIDVHTLAGMDAMHSAVVNKAKAKLLGITILTSQSEDWCRRQFKCSVKEKVCSLALEAASAGLDGIVCAPTDVAQLRADPKLADLLIVTPGIRPAGSERHDQRRITTPAAAIQAGADYLVIGRPITADPIHDRSGDGGTVLAMIGMSNPRAFHPFVVTISIILSIGRS